MLAFLRLFFEILFGGYATPTKCVAFWRVGSEQLRKFYIYTVLTASFFTTGKIFPATIPITNPVTVPATRRTGR